ncbi:MAG: MBL fold metallo-hydrolase [Saprospiraceae bacterium]
MKIQYQDRFITVFESSLYRTTSSVIRLNNSILVVDPNWLPIEVDFIASYCDSHYPDFPVFLLFTHSDYDHIIGYKKFHKAKVIASIYFVNQTSKDKIIHQINEFDDEYYIQRDYPIVYPEADFVIQVDGDKLCIDHIELTFYHAHGHNNDGMIVCIPELYLMIAGDYLSNIEIPMIDDNRYDYTDTLEKFIHIVQEHPNIHMMIAGHGDLAINRGEIIRRLQNDKKYLKILEECMDQTNPTDKSEVYSHLSLYTDNPNMLKIHRRNIEKLNEQ